MKLPNKQDFQKHVIKLVHPVLTAYNSTYDDIEQSTDL